MDEIYHDESLGAHINIVLVRLIIVGYRQVTNTLPGSWLALGTGGGWGTQPQIDSPMLDLRNLGCQIILPGP